MRCAAAPPRITSDTVAVAPGMVRIGREGLLGAIAGAGQRVDLHDGLIDDADLALTKPEQHVGWPACRNCSLKRCVLADRQTQGDGSHRMHIVTRCDVGPKRARRQPARCCRRLRCRLLHDLLLGCRLRCRCTTKHADRCGNNCRRHHNHQTNLWPTNTPHVLFPLRSAPQPSLIAYVEPIEFREGSQ
jgi:hypothetical protein